SLWRCFEKKLRTVRVVDHVVEVASPDCRRLLHASRTAAKVGHASSPDFLAVNWGKPAGEFVSRQALRGIAPQSLRQQAANVGRRKEGMPLNPREGVMWPL